MKSQLSYLAFNGSLDPSPTEFEKQSYILELVSSIEKSAFNYLQIGLEEGCDFFCDMSLIQCLAEKYSKNHHILYFCSLFSSFFPSEQALAQNCLSSLANLPNLSLDERILIIQLHFIHVFRESSNFNESLSDLRAAKTISDRCIHRMQKFWKNIFSPQLSLNSNLFQSLNASINEADSVWNEIIDKYKNH